jgi:hypothetical protein
MPGVIRLETERLAGLVHELGHSDRVENDGAHVHGPVVIVTQPFDGHDVGVLLQVLNLLVDFSNRVAA